MDRAVLVVGFGDGESRFPMNAVLPYARARDLRSQLVEFRAMTRALAEAEGRRPTLLDVGGRARSYVQKSEEFPHCDVTVFDIHPDPGVDVVGDAHEMSRLLPAESFDFAQSLAVFEHLLMPWKVAVELNRVLKPGGVCYIWAPQTHALHDLPWDFFRFSDAAWHALFNAHTGFEILGTDMSLQVHVVPRVYPETPADAEHSAGFMACGVIARKIGPARVDWAVPLGEVIDTSYPLDAPGVHPGG
ncbi:MAG: class I SAM-dependent methyltransferase [Acetobacteraceae bacterium]|nr:class I SAM-dependent methyltransferase [Acetobacteraceae bacterium]